MVEKMEPSQNELGLLKALIDILLIESLPTAKTQEGMALAYAGECGRLRNIASKAIVEYDGGSLARAFFGMPSPPLAKDAAHE